MSIPADRLVAEALAKSGLLWVGTGTTQVPMWHVALDGVAYAVVGPGEQQVPAPEGRTNVVVRAKDSRARLAQFEAQASVVGPDDDDWDAATTALKAARLNAPAGDTVGRWRENNTLVRLVPDLATVVVRGETLPAPSPAQSAASTESAGSAQSADPRAADAPEGFGQRRVAGRGAAGRTRASASTAPAVPDQSPADVPQGPQSADGDQPPSAAREAQRELRRAERAETARPGSRPDPEGATPEGREGEEGTPEATTKVER